MIDPLDMPTLFDRIDRGLLRFTGPKAAWFLDQLVTNDIEHLDDERGAEALLLTPKGKITSAMRVIVNGGSVYADVAADHSKSLTVFLEGRIFATQVEVEDVSDEFHLLSVFGPRSRETVGEVLQRMHMPELEHENCAFGGGLLISVARPVDGVDLWVRAERLDEVRSSLLKGGISPGSEDLLTDIQIISGFAVMGRDYDETFLTQEAAMEHAVHFHKGCYLGQEAVAMAQRGRVKKRLRHLVFDGRGAVGPVENEGDVVGEVKSFAAVGGQSFAIASIKTSVELGSRVKVGEAMASVHELPGTAEGERGPDARALREKLTAE
ncbi:MAG TPA: hypothetical protein VI541_00465 [Actinomycetota bacterium]|nr:hypothetical protein [Actinomycetota bacterium]